MSELFAQRQVSRKGMEPAEGRKGGALSRGFDGATPMVAGPQGRKRPNGFFKKMGDVQLLQFARDIMRANEATTISGLRKADESTYAALRSRKILHMMDFDRKKTDWGSIDNGTLVANALKALQEEGIATRTGLKEKHAGLANELASRGLMGKLGFARMREERAKLKTDAVLAEARRYVAAKGVETQHALRLGCPRIYSALRKRGMLDDVIPNTRKGPVVLKEELLGRAAGFIRETGITNSVELRARDRGLYDLLCPRGLLRAAGFTVRRGVWSSMEDDALLERAKEESRRRNLKNKDQLKRELPGLWAALQRRRLLTAFDGLPRWCDMSDHGLVEHARRFMEYSEISTRSELSCARPGLCSALRARGLLDRVVPRNPAWHRWAAYDNQGLVAYAKRYMQKEGITTRHKLWLLNRSLYDRLLERGLLDEAGVGMVKVIRWSRMLDAEIIAYAQEFMNGRGIFTSGQLEEASPAIYGALKKFRLLARVGFAKAKTGPKPKAHNPAGCTGMQHTGT